MSATAVVPAGKPGTVNVNVAPAPSLAFGAPIPDRVSNTRVGVRPVNPTIGTLGITAVLGADAAEVPIALVALTVNVYAVPFVRLVTVAAVAPVVDAVRPPGAAVTVYPVIGEPPSLTGAVHDTTA